MTATIRPARAADTPEIAEIWNAAIRTSTVTFTTQEKSAAELRDWIGPAHALVVESDGAVRGFAGFGPFRPGPGYRTTAQHSIYIAETDRGRGWGAELLRALEAAAREAGIRVMIAGIGGENPRSVHFHAALGYSQVGYLPGVGEKFGRPQDLILMQKAL